MSDVSRRAAEAAPTAPRSAAARGTRARLTLASSLGSRRSAGACAFYAADTVCAVATCVGATLSSQRFCDGLGTCRPPSQSVSCAPLLCRGDIAQCAGDNCPAGDTICAPGAYCSGNEVCTPRKTPGMPCLSDHECSSGKCIPPLDGGAFVCS